ncbi:MAG: hypothetical protein ACYTFW_11570 [Planctomycetota bacterium]
MFRDLIKYPIENDRLKWEAKHVLKDLWGKPHLMLRIKLTGTRFQERALEPLVTVGKARSLFVEISEDGLAAYAYFDKPVPSRASIEFGYGQGPLLRFKGNVTSKAIIILDPKRFSKGTKNVDRFFPRERD